MNIHVDLIVARLESMLNTDHLDLMYGLIFKLSRLMDEHKSQEQINIAANVLKDQLHGVDGDIFVLEKADIIVVVKSCSMRQIKNAVFQMRYLFADDPLVYSHHNQAVDIFCSVYSCDTGWKQFVTACRKILEAPTTDSTNKAEINHANIFNIIESILDRANFNQFLEINPICLITSKNDIPAKLTICEICFQRDVVLSQLRKTYMILDNIHLANLLFSFAEVRILIKLLKLTRVLNNNAFLLTVSINTINSEDFMIFDTALDEQLKKNITFSFSVHDAFADYELFKKTSSELKERGYKTSISGILSEWLSKPNLKFFNTDFIKIDYRNFFDNTEELSFLDEQSKKTLSIKPQNLIATCIDDATKLEKLRKSGVILFQGKYINKLLGL